MFSRPSDYSLRLDHCVSLSLSAKVDSLYNYGMRPLMYSEHEARTKGIGWVRCGRDVCYYQNHIKRRNNLFYYTFTFSTEFQVQCVGSDDRIHRNQHCHQLFLIESIKYWV
jgi:hypothetical protein